MGDPFNRKEVDILPNFVIFEAIKIKIRINHYHLLKRVLPND